LLFIYFLKAAISETGLLKSVDLRLYCDCGYRFNEATVDGAKRYAQNCYASENWQIVPNAVVTNTPSNTYCRAPGSTQARIRIKKKLLDFTSCKFIKKIVCAIINASVVP
jgi:xanthine dehydrogenase molybdopterin-binding subunit B